MFAFIVPLILQESCKEEKGRHRGNHNRNESFKTEGDIFIKRMVTHSVNQARGETSLKAWARKNGVRHIQWNERIWFKKLRADINMFLFCSSTLTLSCLIFSCDLTSLLLHLSIRVIYYWIVYCWEHNCLLVSYVCVCVIMHEEKRVIKKKIMIEFLWLWKGMGYLYYFIFVNLIPQKS